MRFLVVHAHPSPASFNHVLYEAACRTLTASGHDVAALDLYGDGFVAAMSDAERRAYESPEPILDDQVSRYAELVRWADGLVFVYPTWWMGLPAVLKGWLDRVLVPGVAFHLDDRTRRVSSDLTHLRRIVGITTYGSPRRDVWLMNDAGRRMLARSLRLLAPRRCRTTWLGMYRMDTSTDAERTAFVQRVEQRLSRL
jgi:putative NADPH-quinone reductase